jgi:hypothetical protein
MAEEGKKPDAAAAPANGDAAKENNNKKNQRNKREDKPIEELYDLSKPIPKVRDNTRVMQRNAILLEFT